MDSRYEIRVLGHLGPLLRPTLGRMRCVRVPAQITLCGRLSPEKLRRLLGLLDAHGITLVRLERTERSRGGRRTPPRR